jgi:hypothetical protein
VCVCVCVDSRRGGGVALVGRTPAGWRVADGKVVVMYVLFPYHEPTPQY